MQHLDRLRLSAALVLNRLSLRVLGHLKTEEPEPVVRTPTGWVLVWMWKDADGRTVITLKECD